MKSIAMRGPSPGLGTTYMQRDKEGRWMKAQYSCDAAAMAAMPNRMLGMEGGLPFPW